MAAQARFAISGMTCATCSARLERALSGVPGVRAAAVNLALDLADISYDPNIVTPGGLIRAVDEAGFSARIIDDATSSTRDGQAVFMASVLTAPLVAEMILHAAGRMIHLPPWFALILATPVQFVFGARFYRGAANALRHGSANMDVLVALGTTAAFALSAWRVWFGGDLYLESSAVIITLVLLGKWLESRAKASASAAIRALFDLRPAHARVLRQGQSFDVPVSDVIADDIVTIKAGEKIPVDGIIISGETDCDESMLTGESLPVHRKIDDRVIGGAMNGTGAITIRTTTVGRDATLAKIIRIVEDAQHGKAPVQKMVDRVSAVFVPVVIALALATFAIWFAVGGSFDHAFVPAISVLVIACPCALGLATPAALVAGTAAAARAGILIKNIEALEKARAIDTVALDKTGTLTEGRPTVTSLAIARDAAPNTLALIAAAEAASEHVLARAVVDLAKSRGAKIAPVKSSRAVPGRGIIADVDGHHVVIGNAAMLNDAGVLLDAELPPPPGPATHLFAAIDRRHVATLTLAEPLRPSSPAAIERLRALAVRPIMLSGDRPEIAQAIAAPLGIVDARGGLKPEDKAGEIARLKKSGAVVAMVGDGINDAPALAAADVGIAIGTGTDVAVETADVTLLHPDPRLIAAAISISRATWRKIRQNLFWAMIYNLIALPFAALGALTPALAGAAMAASSVSVVLNALALKRWRAPD
ncbi:MAG: heavy metal translocating P-type ATPase [Alphaproteobacteria bacterium]|nr:heavy metal translocating P-type ATPase [Alphaproteobacteria bacterium]